MTPTTDNLKWISLYYKTGCCNKSFNGAGCCSVYEAIEIAKPKGLISAPDLNVKDKSSKIRLLKENVSLYEVFKIASSYDDICLEWQKVLITFDLAYPYFKTN